MNIINLSQHRFCYFIFVTANFLLYRVLKMFIQRFLSQYSLSYYLNLHPILSCLELFRVKLTTKQDFLSLSLHHRLLISNHSHMRGGGVKGPSSWLKFFSWCTGVFFYCVLTWNLQRMRISSYWYTIEFILNTSQCSEMMIGAGVVKRGERGSNSPEMSHIVYFHNTTIQNIHQKSFSDPIKRYTAILDKCTFFPI